jgi:hypothetical protein
MKFNFLKMKYFVALYLITFFGLSHAQEKIEAPQIAIRIPIGQTIIVEGAEITFVEVLEDSRCPRTVECIWAGRARVKVNVQEVGTDAVSKEVIFGQIKQDEVKDLLLLHRDEFAIKAINVTPYPEKPGEDLEYSLLIRKIRNKDQ